MAEKINSKSDGIIKLEWPEYIRKRPGMFVGTVNTHGFWNLFKSIVANSIHGLGSDYLSFEIEGQNSGKIIIDNIINPVDSIWSKHNKSFSYHFLELDTLNALSSHFKIELFDSDNNPVFNQIFSRGELLEGSDFNKKIKCKTIVVDFDLDDEIWGSEFTWNSAFINDRIRILAYFNKVRLDFSYNVLNERCNVIYYFDNGLKDRLEIEKLKGLGNTIFDSHIMTKINDFTIDLAFAFRVYTVDESMLKSYVNGDYTFENGSHVDGFLLGLKKGINMYLQTQKLEKDLNVDMINLEKILIAFININLDYALFSGSVRNKLYTPQIIEPLTGYISDMIFNKMKADEESASKLISNLRFLHEYNTQ